MTYVAPPRRKSTDYVSNKKLLEAVVEYQKQCKIARDKGVDLPQVPEYIGECFVEIATRFATKPSYSSYSFVDEMIADGIEGCLKAIHGFDVNRQAIPNPFAFFTTAVYYAFLQRIAFEKNQHAVKIKNMIHMLVTEDRYSSAVEDLVDDNLYDFIDKFDRDIAKRKVKK